MPARCAGAGVTRCPFGKEGKPNFVGGKYSQCVWCSEERLVSACRDSKSQRSALMKSFKQMTEAQQARALRIVPEDYQPTFQTLIDKLKRCEGRAGEPCEFHEGNAGEAAHAKKGYNQCLWCSEELLAAACETEGARKKLVRQLQRLSMANRGRVIDHRVPQEHRAFFRTSFPAARGGAAKRPAARRPAAAGEEGAAEAAEEEVALTWSEALEKRQSHRAPASEEMQLEYRKRKLDDRARVRRCFDLGGRVQRGAEVDNSTGLPPPKRSKLAEDLWQWCSTRSWKLCMTCAGMEQADLTQSALSAAEAEVTVPLCDRCKAKVVCKAPSPEDVPEELRGLTEESAAALAHLECNVGPVVRARNYGGQVSGYRQHSAITRFFWKEKSAKDNIKEIKDKEQRRKARAAREYLLKKRGCSYGKYEKAHKQFLKDHRDADERQRRRRLQFIEAPAVETAVWPHLFYEDRWCLTTVRATDSRRRDRATGSTLADFMGGNVSFDDSDADEAADGERHSVKRAYAALALCSRIGYGSSYDFLHFAYDLCLWSALGAKKKTGSDYNVPMRVMMKDHSFSPLYWKSVHWALVDMVRQMGYPKLFWTISPYEWSMPYHEWMLDEMAKELRGRMDLPVAETLHLTHVLLQVVKGGPRGFHTWMQMVLFHFDVSSLACFLFRPFLSFSLSPLVQERMFQLFFDVFCEQLI